MKIESRWKKEVVMTKPSLAQGMIGDWHEQESQLRTLAEQAQRYLITFRWLWLLNLVAAIVGMATRHYELMAVASASSLIALIGAAFSRIGRKTVSATAVESHRIQRQLDPQE